MCVCVYILSHFALQHRLVQHYINFTSIQKKKTNETTAYWILVSIFPPNWEIFLNKTALNEYILNNKKPSYFLSLYSSYGQDNLLYTFPLNRKENAICTWENVGFPHLPSASSRMKMLKRKEFLLPSLKWSPDMGRKRVGASQPRREAGTKDTVEEGSERGSEGRGLGLT